MAKARHIEGLDCRGGLRRGIRLTLATRLAELCDYRASALDFSDIEGVHSMRVSSRRLRSAVRDFKPYLGERLSRERLKRVADALGAVRDEDVAIEALSALAERAAAEADAETAEGVRLLVAERERRRARARRALEEEISEDSLARLREKFLSRLERATGGEDDSSSREAGPSSGVAAGAGPAPQSDGHKPARISFLQAGREIVAARSEELRELSKSLYRPFDSEPLHRMRIAAKRLRYAAELYDQCLGERLKPFARKVAALQKSLGELHDADVWIEDFGARLSDPPKRARRGEVDPASRSERRAALWLLRHFTAERTRHYTDALDCWHGWEAEDFFARLLEAFDSPAGPGEPAHAEPSPLTGEAEPSAVTGRSS